MKKYIKILFITIYSLLLTSCNNQDTGNKIKFAISADYPPYEYRENGELKGLDVELAQLIAKKLGKEAVFEDMQFSSILPALQNGLVDAAISTIAITKERQQKFDFSIQYYTEIMVAVYLKEKPITNKSQLLGKKIACQLGTTMEIWLKKHIHNSETEIITMDKSTIAIEALKARHVDVVLVDEAQGAVFSRKNPGLSYARIAQLDNGYGIAFKKGSSLKEQVDKALGSLKAEGKLKALQQKWITH